MRRRTKPIVDEKSLKHEVKTQFTQNSEEEEQISLDINKDPQTSNENPSQLSDEKLSSQSSEYEEKKPRRRSNSKRKRSMKRTKRQTRKQKKSLNKRSKGQQSTNSKILNFESSQIISRKYQSLFFSEQSLINQIQKNFDDSKRYNKSKEIITKKSKIKHNSIEKFEKKVNFWQINIKKQKESKNLVHQKVNLKDFMLKNGELHITDYEVISKGNSDEQQQLDGSETQTSRILYIFQPKYKVSDEDQKLQKVVLTSNQIAQNHELFIELIRFYRNMWDDNVNVAGMFI